MNLSAGMFMYALNENGEQAYYPLCHNVKLDISAGKAAQARCYNPAYDGESSIQH
jgi:hypothetical protein